MLGFGLEELDSPARTQPVGELELPWHAPQTHPCIRWSELPSLQGQPSVLEPEELKAEPSVVVKGSITEHEREQDKDCSST